MFVPRGGVCNKAPYFVHLPYFNSLLRLSSIRLCLSLIRLSPFYVRIPLLAVPSNRFSFLLLVVAY
jgi:hypothetical protein